MKTTGTTDDLQAIPILAMTDNLTAVYEYCAKSADPVVSALAKKRVDGDPQNKCISIAAEMAHWLAAHPHLIGMDLIHVVCPVLTGRGIEGYDAQGQDTTIARAVAHLLGRNSQSVRIEISETIIRDIHGVTHQSGCGNGIWRKDARPGEQTGDAIWLGNLTVGNLLTFYCFSDDLGRAVFSRIPVGISADCETELVKKQEVLRIAGFFVSPCPLKNQLGDSGVKWECYRHSDECLFANTSSFILSITGQADEEGISDVMEKIKESKRLVEFIDAGETIGVEVTPDNEFTWCVAVPGTVLKSRFDSDANERYQVLDADWMIRLSDGAILTIQGGQDFRGERAGRLTRKIMDGYPGVNANWLSRSMWGELVFKTQEKRLAGKAPLMGRNAIHRVKKSLPESLSGMPEKDADEVRAILESVLPANEKVNDVALRFFQLMEDKREEQAYEYLNANRLILDNTDPEGDTPLMKAVEARSVKIIKLLLELGADVNIVAGDGFSALHIGARNGLTSICEKLLDAGARVDDVTPLGWTPLMCAIQAEFAGCARMLVRRGAKADRPSHLGTPLSMAKARGINLREQ